MVKVVSRKRIGGRENCIILDMKKVEIKCIHQKNERIPRKTEVAP